MLKFFNANQKNYLKKLDIVLSVRKLQQKNQSSSVKKILYDVRKGGDKAVIKYEKKFSKIKLSPKNIKFSKNEIKMISKKIDKNLKNSIDIAC